MSLRRLISNGNQQHKDADLAVLLLAKELGIRVIRVRKVRARLLRDYNPWFVENPQTPLSGIITYRPQQGKRNNWSVVLIDRTMSRWDWPLRAERDRLPQWLVLLHEVAHVYLRNIDADETQDGMYAWEIAAYEAMLGENSWLRQFYRNLSPRGRDEVVQLGEYRDPATCEEDAYVSNREDGARWGARVRQKLFAEKGEQLLT